MVFILVFALLPFFLWNLTDFFACTFFCFQFLLHIFTRVNFLQNKENDIILLHVNVDQFPTSYGIKTRHAAEAHTCSIVSCLLASPPVYLDSSHMAPPSIPRMHCVLLCLRVSAHAYPSASVPCPAFFPWQMYTHHSKPNSEVRQSPSSTPRALLFLTCIWVIMIVIAKSDTAFTMGQPLMKQLSSPDSFIPLNNLRR